MASNLPFFMAPQSPMDFQRFHLDLNPTQQQLSPLSLAPSQPGFPAQPLTAQQLSPILEGFGYLNKSGSKKGTTKDDSNSTTNSRQSSEDKEKSNKTSSGQHNSVASTKPEPVGESEMSAADKFASSQSQNKDVYDSLLNYKKGLQAVNDTPVNDASWTNPLSSFLNSQFGTKLAPVEPSFSAKDKLQALLQYSNGQTGAAKDYASQLLEYSKARGLGPNMVTKSDGTTSQTDVGDTTRNTIANTNSTAEQHKKEFEDTRSQEGSDYGKPMMPKGAGVNGDYNKWVPQWNQVRKESEKSMNDLNTLKGLMEAKNYGAAATAARGLLVKIEGRRAAAGGNQSLLDQSIGGVVQQLVDKRFSNQMSPDNIKLINQDIDSAISSAKQGQLDAIRDLKGQYDSQVSSDPSKFYHTVKTALPMKHQKAIETIEGNYSPEQKQEAMDFLKQERL